MTFQMINRVFFRVIILVIYSIPCFIHMTIRRNVDAGPEFIQKASFFFQS